MKQPIPAELRWEVWERDDFRCRHCGTRRFLSIDHIVPESNGGAMEMDNLQTLCWPCNKAKGRLEYETQMKMAVSSWTLKGVKRHSWHLENSRSCTGPIKAIYAWQPWRNGRIAICGACDRVVGLMRGKPDRIMPHVPADLMSHNLASQAARYKQMLEAEITNGTAVLEREHATQALERQ